MSKYNTNNERIKRKYLTFLKQAKGQSEASIDAVAAAIARFEKYNKYRDFKQFHFEQAIGFKRYLAKQTNHKTGKPLSLATINSATRHLKNFIQWLSQETGYRSRITYSDAEYFNIAEKDVRAVKSVRQKPVATLEQIKHVLTIMPSGTALERRNRALIAFTLLTGARDSAIASIKLKHVNLEAGSVFQDAREVRTKFSKTFTTYFFPVGDGVRVIFDEWVRYLKEQCMFGHDDPLFPKTKLGLGADQNFEAVGLSREHWSSASPIRQIFKDAFALAELPYFNPHSFRNTLVVLGEKLCQSPEEFKAWSQNLGHEQVLTTFCSYGEVQSSRQSEIFKQFGKPSRVGGVSTVDEIAIAKAVARELGRTQAG